MAAKKKATRKKATKKKATKKKKPATKKKPPIKKKPAAKKKPATKTAPSPKPTSPAVAPSPAAPDFPPEVAALCEAINGGGHELDMEGYESFNEQYKPGDWTRNPGTNGLMLTFCMDGAGGQFTLWLQPGKALLDNPVVQLGDDGALHVLASDFASFCALTAAGVNFFERTPDELTPAAPVQAMVASTWPGRVFPSPAEIMSAAAAAYPDFEGWMRAQVKS